MKTRLLGAAALLTCFVLTPHFAFCDSTDQGCNNPRMVRSWVELPLGGPEGVPIIEKTLYRCGDRIALGIVQSFTPKQLLDAGRIERMLSVIRVSFSHPEFIVEKDDRNPRVTMLLLYYLEHETREERLRREILDMEQYVSSQTGKGSAGGPR